MIWLCCRFWDKFCFCFCLHNRCQLTIFSSSEWVILSWHWHFNPFSLWFTYHLRKRKLLTSSFTYRWLWLIWDQIFIGINFSFFIINWLVSLCNLRSKFGQVFDLIYDRTDWFIILAANWEGNTFTESFENILFWFFNNSQTLLNQIFDIIWNKGLNFIVKLFSFFAYSLFGSQYLTRSRFHMYFFQKLFSFNFAVVLLLPRLVKLN